MTRQPQRGSVVVAARSEPRAPITRTTGRDLAAAREAFRCRRLASDQVRLYAFCVEHNLFDEARRSRKAMLEHLREARRQWRAALGISP